MSRPTPEGTAPYDDPEHIYNDSTVQPYDGSSNAYLVPVNQTGNVSRQCLDENSEQREVTPLLDLPESASDISSGQPVLARPPSSRDSSLLPQPTTEVPCLSKEKSLPRTQITDSSLADPAENKALLGRKSQLKRREEQHNRTELERGNREELEEEGKIMKQKEEVGMTKTSRESFTTLPDSLKSATKVRSPLSMEPIVLSREGIRCQHWTVEHVGEWLKEMGFEQSIIGIFKNNRVSGEKLLGLKRKHLKAFGIADEDVRNSLKEKINALKKPQTAKHS